MSSVDREYYKKWKLNWLDFYPANSVLVKLGQEREIYISLAPSLDRRDKQDKPNLGKCPCKVSCRTNSVLMQISENEIQKMLTFFVPSFGKEYLTAA